MISLKFNTKYEINKALRVIDSKIFNLKKKYTQKFIKGNL